MTLRLNKNEIFELGWAILLFCYLFIISSEIGLMYSTNLLKYITFTLVVGLWSYKIFNDKYKLHVFLLMVMGVVIVGITAIQSSREILLLMIVFVVAAKDIDIKHFVSIDMRIRLAIIIVLFVLSMTGVISNFSREINGSLKYAFGWQHPNTCAAAIILVMLEWMYLKWENFKLKNWLIVAAVIAFLIKFIAARTSLISFGVLCVWFIIVHHIKPRNHPILHKISGILYTMSYLLIALISFILVSEYQKKTALGIALNQLMTTRLRYSSYYLVNYGIPLLGQPIETISTRQALLSGTVYSGVDMAFINIAIQYGVIYTIVFLAFYTYLCYWLYRNNHYQELLLVLFFAIVGFTSNAMTIFYRNFTIIFIWLIYKERKEKKYLPK